MSNFSDKVSTESNIKHHRYLINAYEIFGGRGVFGIGKEWHEHWDHSSALFLSTVRQFSSKAAPAGKMLYTNSLHEHYRHTVRAQVVLRTTEELKSMDPERRRCYYPHEKKLQAFEEYSKVNCELECTWKVALGECGCVPWFLKEHFPYARLCTWHGNACFKQYVQNYSAGSTATHCSSECLNDCETFTFEVDAKGEGRKIFNIIPGDFESKCLSGSPLEEYQEMACEYLLTRMNNTHSLVMKMIPNDPESL